MSCRRGIAGRDPGPGGQTLRALFLAMFLSVPGVIETAPAAAGPAAPASTLQEAWRALGACWRAPTGFEGFEITLRFGLGPTGALRGPPMVTYLKRIGPPERQRAFAVAAIEALTACTPVRLTPTLGRVLGTRVLSIRFRGDAKREAI